MDHASGLVFHRPQAASHRRSVVYFCSAVLRLIRQSQSVGLSLDDISALLDFNGKRGKTHCRGVQKLLTSRLADLDAKIDALTTFRHMLSAYLDACERAVQTERNPRCPVMDDLTTRSIEPCPAEH